MTAGKYSRLGKQKFLENLSEDGFRDKVVRPLLLRLGYRDGRDLCGPEEEGKDALFYEVDKFGKEQYVAVQTKIGNVTMAGDPTKNLLTIETQLRTAIETSYALPSSRKKIAPYKAILVASGRINQRARHEIVENRLDSRIEFLDRDDLIELLDEKFPEIWLGLERAVSPYFSAIRRIALGDTNGIDVGNNAALKQFLYGPFASDGYIELNLIYFESCSSQIKGVISQRTEIKDLKASDLLNTSDQKILVDGDPGSGKSTLFLRLALNLAELGVSSKRHYKIPIILRAKDICDLMAVEILESAAEFTRKITNLDSSAFGLEDVQEGRVLLLVDALDEVGEFKKREFLISQLDSLCEEYSKLKVLVSTRPTTSITEIVGIRSYRKYSISPISWRQASKLFNSMTTGRQLSEPEAMEFVRSLEQVYGLELNPLLLSVFSATSEYDRRDIPANITELFKKFTELLLGRWDEQKGLKQQHQAPLKDFLVQRLAFQMHFRGETAVDLSDIQTLFAEELQRRGYSANQLESVMEELISRSGLFRRVNTRVEFRHHLLQEFFAGRALGSVADVKEFLASDWWRRPIVFFFGDNPDKLDDLLDVATSLPYLDSESIWNSAITIGLATQACYLSDVEDKLMLWKWVASALGANLQSVVELQSEYEEYPLVSFITAYVIARDAVSLTNLRSCIEQVRTEISNSSLDDAEKERSTFWLLVALIEIGAISECKELIEEFNPRDRRLLLALDLGCHLASRVKASTQKVSKDFKEVERSLQKKIPDLSKQAFDEFGSLLVEMRKGKLTPIPDLDE